TPASLPSISWPRRASTPPTRCWPEASPCSLSMPCECNGNAGSSCWMGSATALVSGGCRHLHSFLLANAEKGRLVNVSHAAHIETVPFWSHLYRLFIISGALFSRLVGSIWAPEPRCPS